MSGCRRRRLAALPAIALTAVVAVGVVGCTSGRPGPPACTATWSTVDLPAGVVPLGLTASGSVVLVGGSSPVDDPGSRSPATGPAATGSVAASNNPDAAAQGDSGTRRPRLFRLSGAAVAEIPLTPQSPYGQLAQLVYLAIDGHAVAAVGTATGGAHLNPRWTVWRGTLDGLTEQPQGMETFGGWNAGSLDGLALDPAGPLLIGSWSTGPGSIATALWTTSGATWQRDPGAAALAGTADRRAEPTGIAVLDGQILVSGFDIAGATAALRAGLWSGDRSGHWRRVDLPGAAPDSVATGVACRADGCWVVGRIGKGLALWRYRDGVAARVQDVPAMTVAPIGQTPMVVVSDHLVWVQVAGSDASPAVQLNGSWTRVGSPGPTVTAIATSATTLLAITGSVPATSLTRRCIDS